jgi:hypothetical protein
VAGVLGCVACAGPVALLDVPAMESAMTDHEFNNRILRACKAYAAAGGKQYSQAECCKAADGTARYGLVLASPRDPLIRRVSFDTEHDLTDYLWKEARHLTRERRREATRGSRERCRVRLLGCLEAAVRHHNAMANSRAAWISHAAYADGGVTMRFGDDTSRRFGSLREALGELSGIGERALDRLDRPRFPRGGFVLMPHKDEPAPATVKDWVPPPVPPAAPPKFCPAQYWLALQHAGLHDYRVVPGGRGERRGWARSS